MIAACLKSVDLRPEVDALTGAVRTDPRRAGASDADLAALEWALRAAHAAGDQVVALTAGQHDAEAVLRDAVAAGAARAVRVDVDPASPSEVVAAALAPHVAGCAMVWCGDLSFDRGSGAVPAYLAARLGVAQALGLVSIEEGPAGSLLGVRRLDAGQRERVRLQPPIVCSVEGAAARLRRASVAAVLAARTTPVELHAGPRLAAGTAVATRPYRPRARAVAAPRGVAALARIRALTAAPAAAAHGPPVALDADAAAERILESLTTWGYIDR